MCSGWTAADERRAPPSEGNHETLMINGTAFLRKNCNSRHVPNSRQSGKQIHPRGTFFFKILHSIYPSNESLARFLEIDKAPFVSTLQRLAFVKCSKSAIFWKAIAEYLTRKTQIVIKLIDEIILCNFSRIETKE